MQAMRTTCPKRLDENNRLDVVKFAMTLHDPLNPHKVPNWMKGLLKGKPNSHPNRIEAITTQGVTKKWPDKDKAIPT